MNKTLKEVSIILAMAVLIGLLYNYFSDKPLRLIQKSNNNSFVSDSDLFRELQKNKYVSNDTIKIKKDTIKKIQKDSLIIKKDSNKITRTSDNILMISYKQLVKLLGNPDVIFIDARRPEDYNKSHIGKAINIFPEEAGDEHFRKIAGLDINKTYVVYCDGGACDLSHEVIQIMQSFGFKRVFLFPGGWEEWIKNHRI